MGRGVDEEEATAVLEAPSRRGASRSNAHNVGGRLVIELNSEEKLTRAHRLAEEMENLVQSRGQELAIDPAVVASIPESDPERALAYYLGDRSLILDPDQVTPGMRDASQMLSEAIDKGERIALFCDYDVDGVTAGEVMRNTLSWYGADPLMGYAGMRDGFGLSEEFVEEAFREGCSTIITVDCGSASEEAVMLAKELGMNVIVTDHHNATGHDDNVADFHLNPNLWDPPLASATGAQMSWYLAAALQETRDGSVREEHYRENLYLAGLGCSADFGDPKDAANRPFLVADSIPENITKLAEEKRESPQIGRMINTTALLNLAKRTDAVGGADVAKLLRAENEEEFREALEHLQEAKKAQDKVRREMTATVKETYSRLQEPGKTAVGDQRIVHHVFDDPEGAGSAGTVADQFAKTMGTPAFVFVKLKDENGEEIYKFSGRAPDRTQKIGRLKEDGELIAITGENNVGGHDEVFSGTCRKEDIPRIVKAIENWAQRQDNFYPERDGEDKIFVSERLVSAERLAAVEEGVSRMAPYNAKIGHYPSKTSVKGTIKEITRKGNSHTTMLLLENGEEHLVSVSPHANKERGADGKITHMEVIQGEEVEVFLEHRLGRQPIVRHTAPLG